MHPMDAFGKDDLTDLLLELHSNQSIFQGK